MASLNNRQKAIEYLIEFILVIVGISIAFWLSELAEDAKKDELEKQYLQDLKEDLIEDIELLDYLTLLNQDKAEKLNRALSYYVNPNVKLNLDSVTTYAAVIGNLNMFQPNNFTYVSLKQSGDFKIIKDHDIRKTLVKLYSSYETVDLEQQNLMRALDDHYYPEYFKNYEMISGKVINEAFFKGPYVSNFLAFSHNQTNNILVYFERSKTLAEQTVALIDEDLKK